MGRISNLQKRGSKRTFGYLGASSAWSFGLFIFFFYMLSFISFLTDAVRLENFDPLWFIVSGAGFLPPIAIGLAYRFAYLNRRLERQRVALNLIIAGLAGASRNVSVGLFALWAGLDQSQLWLFRFFGGAFMGVAIFILWAIGNGSKIEYLSALRSLAETQNRLSSTRLQMPDQLASVNERLQERTKQALIPQLNAIRELLGEASTVREALDKLRFTITEQIRPMMLEISKDQPKPFKVQNLRKFRSVSAKLPDRFTLHDKLMVTWSSVVESLGVSIWLVVFGSPNGLLDIFIIFSIYFLVLSVFKFLLPNGRTFPRFNAIAYTLLVGFLASLANVYYVYRFLGFNTPQFVMLSGFAILSGIIGPLLLMQLSVRIEKRNEIESQITGDLLAIAKENALFAQRLWVFRKRWLLILHGSVQSSLTAALTRLQVAPEINAVTIEMVKQDLRRAELAVESNHTEGFNLDLGISELQEVWAGICTVKVQVSSRAKRALIKNPDSSYCVNEIVKEAVSNAVRHGEASEAQVTIDRISDDLLTVEVTNNGRSPKDDDRTGFGSEMLDEVCLHWELITEKKQVRLVAELPIKL